MQKIVLTFVGLLSILALAACGGTAAPNSDQAATTPGAAAGLLNTTYADALPVVSQLILGSLKLEEGDLAVSAEQAGKLLPLWQAYQSLSNSDSTAQAELDGLLAQIQQTMRPEQIQAISAQQLTAEDFTELLQALGPGFFRGGNDTGNADGATSGRGLGAGGGFPGGGPGGGFPGGLPVDGPPGGLPGGGAGEVDPAARATAMAERLSQGGDQAASFMTRGILNQLITALQLKTGDVTEEELQAEQAQRTMLRWTGVVSDTIGIPADTLRQAITEGSTLAQAIAAQGGDVEKVKAALRKALKNNPDLDDATIEAQIDQALNGTVAAGQ